MSEVIALLLSALVVSAVTCLLVERLFRQPIGNILNRLVGDPLADAWYRYLSFAIFVVGFSAGSRVWALEQYILPRPEGAPALELTGARWVLEIYRALMGTLQGIAWMLLVFFIFALIAFVILRGFELRRGGGPKDK